jgi:hypothetical protein
MSENIFILIQLKVENYFLSEWAGATDEKPDVILSVHFWKW